MTVTHSQGSQESGADVTSSSSGGLGSSRDVSAPSLESAVGMSRPAVIMRMLAASAWITWLLQWAPLAARIASACLAAITGAVTGAGGAALQAVAGVLLACPETSAMTAMQAVGACMHGSVRPGHVAVHAHICILGRPHCSQIIVDHSHVLLQDHLLSSVLHICMLGRLDATAVAVHACTHPCMVPLQPSLRDHAPDACLPACLQGAWEVVAEGQAWRLLSAGLLHGGLLPLMVRAASWRGQGVIGMSHAL